MDLMQLLLTRRTYRRFDSARPVPGECLRDMKEALRLASCGGNAQRLRWIFVTDPALAAAVFPHTHWAAALPPEVGTPREGERPVMYAALCFDRAACPGGVDTDAGLALSNLTAWAHGVGSCIMGNIDRPEIARLLGLPGTWAIHTVTAFGYPTHTSRIVDVPPDGSLKYYLDRDGNYCVPRKPLSETVFDNRFPGA